MRKLTNDQTTMRVLTITLLLTFPFSLFAQDKIVGRYRNYFGSRIQLKADSTFKYTWHFDMSGSWTKGTWFIKNDTVYFHMIPMYDTLSYSTPQGLNVDSLILSTDEKAERFTQEQYAGMGLSSGGQNRMTYPVKMFYKDERLYNIKNQKLVKKKQRGFWSKQKYIPWYFKYQEI